MHGVLMWSAPKSWGPTGEAIEVGSALSLGRTRDPDWARPQKPVPALEAPGGARRCLGLAAEGDVAATVDAGEAARTAGSEAVGRNVVEGLGDVVLIVTE